MSHTNEPLTSEKERAILDAARARFAYYGFSKVTMDEIAADVSMAKASLYYYFPTKEQLLESVLGQERAQFLAEIGVILRKPIPASEKLKKYAQKRFELFRELVNLSALSFSRMGEANNTLGSFFYGLEEEEVNLVLQILLEGKRSGEFRLSNPQQTAELIPHALQGLRVRAIRKLHDARPAEDLYDAIKQEGKVLIEHLLHGMLRKSHQ